MYTSSGSQVANGTTPFRPPRRTLALRTEQATEKAQSDFAALLCRNPKDFVRFGLNVAKDVQQVNTATGCGPGSGSASSTGAASSVGDAVAAAALASLGVPAGGNAGSGPGGNAGSTGGIRNGWRDGRSYNIGSGGACSTNEGGVKVIPLNGPGGAGLPAVSAAPARLTFSTRRPYRSMGRVARSPKGMGACCSGFPGWGDAFADGGVPASTAFDQWLLAHPWLTAGLVVGGLLLLSAAGKKRRA